MKVWMPSNQSIFRFYLIASFFWIAAGILYNQLSIEKILIIGLGLGLVFVPIYILQHWINHKKRLRLLENYTNNTLFKNLNCSINGNTLRVEILDNIVELTINVIEESEVICNLKINFINNINFSSKHIQNILGKEDFIIDNNKLLINNWKPRSFKFEKLIKELSEFNLKLDKASFAERRHEGINGT
jgi:hypothetical protein